MSSKVIICFDASVKGNTVGVGVWDYTHKVKIHKVFTTPAILGSHEAETMAMITALQYLNENSIYSAHLFTDNMAVYNEGISKKLLRKYVKNISSVELFWIPREFNKEADELSKIKKGPSEVNKVNINTLVSSPSWNLKAGIKSYSVERRINLLKRLANTQFQMDFINSIENNTTVNKVIETEDKVFVKLTASIINKRELKGLANYLDSYGITFSKFLASGNIEKYIRNKNLI